MKNYETVFILNPALSEEQVQKSVDKYEKYLKSNGAKIISKEIWGLKKLAYTIENKNSGFYNLLEYTAPADVVSSIEHKESNIVYVVVLANKNIIHWLLVPLVSSTNFTFLNHKNEGEKIIKV